MKFSSPSSTKVVMPLIFVFYIIYLGSSRFGFLIQCFLLLCFPSSHLPKGNLLLPIRKIHVYGVNKPHISFLKFLLSFIDSSTALLVLTEENIHFSTSFQVLTSLVLQHTLNTF